MSEQSEINSEHNNTGKALMLVSARYDNKLARTVVADAGFLVQMIACRAGIAAYRRHRREEPNVASGLYRIRAAQISEVSQVACVTIKVA